MEIIKLIDVAVVWSFFFISALYVSFCHTSMIIFVHQLNQRREDGKMNKSEIRDLLNKCSLENETCKYLSYLSALYHGDSFPLLTGFDES